MFSQEYGLINFIIQSFGGTPAGMVAQLRAFHVRHRLRLRVDSIGFNMIIYVGGISNISPDLY